MANVVGVKQNPKRPEQAFVRLDDGTDAWCPSFELAEKLEIGKPPPEDWKLEQGEYGPRLLPPRPAGGRGGAPAAFRNTAEGQRAEQASIHRSVALGHAVDLMKHCKPGELDLPLVVDVASVFYDWLQQTPDAPLSPPAAPNKDAGNQQVASGTSHAGRATRDGGTGKAPAVPACPACGSASISRKGKTWKCADCDQTWEA